MTQDSFSKRVVKIALSIPKGKVTTYVSTDLRHSLIREEIKKLEKNRMGYSAPRPSSIAFSS